MYFSLKEIRLVNHFPGGQVQLLCEDGHWQRVAGRDLISMYKACKIPQNNPTVR